MHLREDRMTSAERIDALFNYKKPDRVPLGAMSTGFNTRNAGHTVADAYEDPEKSFADMQWTTEQYGWDPVPQYAGHTVLGAWDFGGKVRTSIAEFEGALVVTEAITRTTELHRRTSAWGIAGLAARLVRLYPALAGIRVRRAWGAPTPVTPDEEPIVGWWPERDNLFVAAGFLLTITALPLLSEWMARMLLGEGAPADLSLFDPGRFTES